MHTFKKYPNRRLYDADKGAFSTLDAIKELILAGETVQVLDSKSGEDLTRSVLLQIISEQEAQTGQSLLTDQVLLWLIRFYGDNMQGLLREYLERSLSLFSEQQEVLRKQMGNLVNPNPMKIFSDIAQNNIKLWQNISGSNNPK